VKIYANNNVEAIHRNDNKIDTDNPRFFIMVRLKNHENHHKAHIYLFI